MKKKITGSVLSAGAIVLGLAAAGCGGAIENAANGWAMLGYTLLAIVLGCAALALAGLGLVAEQRKEPPRFRSRYSATASTFISSSFASSASIRTKRNAVLPYSSIPIAGTCSSVS